MEYVFCVGILLASLLQGGYFPTVFLLAGMLFAVVGAVRGKRSPRTAELILWCFAGWYLLASAVNGWSSSSMAQACLPGAAAAALYCGGGLAGEKRDRALRLLVGASAVLAGVGLLAFGGVVEFSGAITARRLQFPFQYANAAGSWYAALALIAQEDQEKTGRAWPLPFLQAALFLTRSIGALGLYALAQLAYVIVNRKKPERWQSVLLSNGVSVCFAIGFFLTGAPWAALLLLAAMALASWRFQRLLALGRRIYLHWLTLAGVAAAFPVLGGGRLLRGLATFAERLCQIQDGLRILASHPVFGLGAEGWAYAYPLRQSARYVSAVVHSGPVQFGVDAGVPAVLLIALFCVLAFRRGKRPLAVSLAAALLAGHSLFDFNLQFFPLAVLTGFLLLCPEGEAPKRTLPAWAVRTVLLCFAALCAVPLAGELQYKQMVYAAQRGDWAGALARYEENAALFGQNPDAKATAANAAGALRDWERVLDLTAGSPEPEPDQLLLRAQALRETGEEAQACRFLLDELERRPFQVELYQGTAQLLTRWDAEEDCIRRYNALAERFNSTQTILTALEGDGRVYIDKIQEKESET